MAVFHLHVVTALITVAPNVEATMEAMAVIMIVVTMTAAIMVVEMITGAVMSAVMMIDVIVVLMTAALMGIALMTDALMAIIVVMMVAKAGLDMIVPQLHMSIPPVRYVSYMDIQLVTVGGAVLMTKMMLIIMRRGQILHHMALIQTGTLILARQITS
jgi:hypothetical protein